MCDIPYWSLLSGVVGLSTQWVSLEERLTDVIPAHLTSQKRGERFNSLFMMRKVLLYFEQILFSYEPFFPPLYPASPSPHLLHLRHKKWFLRYLPRRYQKQRQCSHQIHLCRRILKKLLQKPRRKLLLLPVRKPLPSLRLRKNQ